MIRKSPPLPPPAQYTSAPRPVSPSRHISEQLLNHQEPKARMSGWERLLIILFLAIGLAGVWSFWHFRQAEKSLNNKEAVVNQLKDVKKENAALVAKLGRLMVLPEGEEPIVATISDVTSLAKNQPFYANAHNGDKVIVYMKAKKAIIYDPNADKIINVGPIFLESQNATSTSSGTPTESLTGQPEPTTSTLVTIEVRNGSSTPGIARVFAEKFVGSQSYKVLDVNPAARKDYGKNIIVNLAGKDVASLSKMLGNITPVTKLPTGEATTAAEVLVIMGK